MQSTFLLFFFIYFFSYISFFSMLWLYTYIDLKTSKFYFVNIVTLRGSTGLERVTFRTEVQSFTDQAAI